MAAVAAGAGVGLQLIGAAAATLLAAVLVAAVLGRRRRPPARAPLVEGKPAPEDGRAVGDGEGAAGDGGTDVIIVGAGVAGSALAYTLGKVSHLSHPSRSFVRIVSLGGRKLGTFFFRLKSLAFIRFNWLLIAWREEQGLVSVGRGTQC